MSLLRLTKLDAARAQLDAAIELFFTSDNPVAVHTLCAAAYNVLRDLAKRDGLEFPFIKTGFMKSLAPTERSAVHNFIHAAENFFKHADRDPSETLELNPELTELLLLDACSYFKQVSAPSPRNLDALKVWSGSLRQDIEPESAVGRFIVATVAALKSAGKPQFWQWYNELLEHRRAEQSAL